MVRQLAPQLRGGNQIDLSTDVLLSGQAVEPTVIFPTTFL